MPGYSRTRLLLVVLLGLAMAGCGFRLAGTTSLPPEMRQISLLASDFSEQQRDALQKKLRAAGAEIAGQTDKQALRLSVSLIVLPDVRLVTSASSGKTIERLARSLNYSLKSADGKLLAPARMLIRQKDIVLDDDNLLSSAVERRSVIEDLEQALFKQLIHQLKRF